MPTNPTEAGPDGALDAPPSNVTIGDIATDQVRSSPGIRVQLSSPPVGPFTGETLSEAVQYARNHRGHAPAITAVTADRRDEHGVANLAQWIGKGAHLLLTDHSMQPGDVVAIAAPITWTTAMVCHAAWWVGAHVVWAPTLSQLPDDADATVMVVHDAVADVQHGLTAPCYWLGDRVDGSSDQVSWSIEAQLFPDYPPPASPTDPALTIGPEVFTNRELIERARLLGTGTIGIDETTDATIAMVAGCVRPFVALAATVILRGVPHSAAAGDRVATWH